MDVSIDGCVDVSFFKKAHQSSFLRAFWTVRGVTPWELGDLSNGERLQEPFSTLRFDLGHPLLSPLIDAAFLRQGDAGRLVLLHGGKVKRGDGKEEGRHKLARGACQVELLGDGDDADALIQSDPHGGDAANHGGGETVELP